MAGVLSPWSNKRPGEEQGRVENPSGFAQPEGDYAFVMGTDTPGWTGRFAVGDTFALAQGPDVIAPGKILRFSGKFRGPAQMPAVSVAEPAPGYVLADGQTLILAVDGGGNQTVTFSTGQFVAIGAARAAEVMAAMNAVLTGAAAYKTGEGVGVLSATSGRRSRVEVVGGTAAALGFQELAWRFQLLLAGTVVASRDLQPGEEESLNDMAGNLAAHGDPAEVRFRLVLVAV